MTCEKKKSFHFFNQYLMPGGVNSPVRVLDVVNQRSFFFFYANLLMLDNLILFG